MEVEIIPFYTKHCESIYFSTPTWYDSLRTLSFSYYERFKKGDILILPWMLMCMTSSLGFIPWPRPLKLDTFLGKPIYLKCNESKEEFTLRTKLYLQTMIDIINEEQDTNIILQKLAAIDPKALSVAKESKKKSDDLTKLESIRRIQFSFDLTLVLRQKLDRIKRRYDNYSQLYKPLMYIEQCLSAIVYFVFGVYMVIQNLFFTLLLHFCISTIFPVVLLYVLCERIVSILSFPFRASKRGKLD